MDPIDRQQAASWILKKSLKDRYLSFFLCGSNNFIVINPATIQPLTKVAWSLTDNKNVKTGEKARYTLRNSDLDVLRPYH